MKNIDDRLQEAINTMVKLLNEDKIGIDEWVAQINVHYKNKTQLIKLMGCPVNVTDEVIKVAHKNISFRNLESIFVIGEVETEEIIIGGADVNGLYNVALLKYSQGEWALTAKITSDENYKIKNPERLTSKLIIESIISRRPWYSKWI